MNILVFGEKYFNYTDSTVYALKQLGHNVEVVYMPVLNKSNLSIKEYVLYKLGNEDFIKSFYDNTKNEILELIDEFKPEVFISINGNQFAEYIDHNILYKLKNKHVSADF